MLKNLSIVLIALLAGTAMAAQIAVDTSLSDTLNLSHKVSRVSQFSVQALASGIPNTDPVTIGEITVKNNTRDGFSVKITSKYFGVLKALAPDGVSDLDLNSNDGEEDIPYSLSISKDGVTGAGMDELLTFSDADLSAGDVFLLKKAQIDGNIASKTDVKYSVDVVIDSSLEDLMSMAGTYKDTLTITYQDL